MYVHSMVYNIITYKKNYIKDLSLPSPTIWSENVSWKVVGISQIDKPEFFFLAYKLIMVKNISQFGKNFGGNEWTFAQSYKFLQDLQVKHPETKAYL